MRRLRRILMWLAGLSIFLCAFGYWQWHSLLTRLQLSELQIDFAQFSFSELTIGHLHVRIGLADQTVSLDIQQANIAWQWQGLSPAITHVLLGDTSVRVDDLAAPKVVSERSPWQLPIDWRVPNTFPARVFVESLRLSLPCASGHCEFVGQLESFRVKDVVRFHGELNDAPTPVQLELGYDASNGLPRLDITLAAPGLLNYRLKTELQTQTQTQTQAQTQAQTQFQSELVWLGESNIEIFQPSAAWQDYLIAKNERANFSWLQAINDPLKSNISWQLALAPLLELVNQPVSDNSFLDSVRTWPTYLAGNLAGELDLSSPVPLARFGDLSGQAQIQADFNDGKLAHYKLAADLNVATPVLPQILTGYDLAWQNLRLTLTSQIADLDMTALPLAFSLVTQGSPAVTLSGAALLDIENISVVLNDGQLLLAADNWSPVPEVTMTKLHLEQLFSATWQAEQQAFSYHLTAPSALALNLTTPAVQLHNAKMTNDELVVAGSLSNWQNMHLSTKAVINITELQHAQLHPKPWQWRGQITAAEQALELDGLLIANDQLNLTHHIALTPEQLTLDWHLADVFLLASTDLPELTPLWPSLLTLARGRVGAKGGLVWAFSDALPQLDAKVMLTGVSGLYDTTAFKGVNGELDIKVSKDSLALTTDQLKLDELTQGFVLGPVVAAGHYQADLSKITDGRLTLVRLQSGLLGGRVIVPAGVLDFAQPKQTVLVELQRIDLAQLLAEHPAGDLQGSGRVSGVIPVVLSASGIQVEKGFLSAEAPGGLLQYHSDNASDLAATSQGMKIITDALDDFHYTLLSSDVSYDETGKLLLGVRLEGSNPAVEAGRPINFNINLEEDLPALIYSLQLTDQLNDVIKKRVQQKMRRKVEP